MHRSSTKVCTALGTVLSHQSRTLYSILKAGMLHPLEAFCFSRLKVLIIAGRILILLLIIVIYWFSFLIIPYSYLLTTFWNQFFFLIFSPWLAGVSFIFNINPILACDTVNNFPSLLSIINFISGFLKQISFIFKYHNYQFFFLCFAIAILFKKCFITLGDKYVSYFLSKSFIDFSSYLSA